MIGSEISEQRDSHSSGEKHAAKTLPIINPLVRLPQWPSEYDNNVIIVQYFTQIAFSNFCFVLDVSETISKALLANADALCAAAVPLMDPDEILQ